MASSFSFSLLAQRKRNSSVLYGERKGSRSLDPAMRDYPALLETTGSLKTRYAQTGQTPVSVVSVVLGCVKWHFKKLLFLYFKECPKYCAQINS